MGIKKRLSAEERRISIVESAMPVFVQKGFACTTTREIAEAAGVSEALLYKHFSSKDDIYREILDYCCSNYEEYMDEVVHLPVNTDSLIKCVKYFIGTLFKPKKTHATDVSFSRLMFNSLLEDGDFARMFLEERCRIWQDKISSCYRYAIEEGDIITQNNDIISYSWLIHHLHVGVMIMNMPTNKVVDYQVSPEEMTRNALVFTLRGLGLREDLIP